MSEKEFNATMMICPDCGGVGEKVVGTECIWCPTCNGDCTVPKEKAADEE